MKYRQLNKRLLFVVLLFFSVLSGCNMDLENPNDLTITLSSRRGILDGHAVIYNLEDDAEAVILKIRQYSGETKTYKTDDLVISGNSVTLPGGIKSGQGFDIELLMMNKVCTYIARAKNITIEPYTSQVITCEVEEAKPHIILPKKKTPNHTFLALPDPEKKDFYFESNLSIFSNHKYKGFDFDKYGRFLYLVNEQDTSSPPIVTSQVKSSSGVFKSGVIYTGAGWSNYETLFCVDAEADTFYYSFNDKIFKRKFNLTNVGSPIEGVRLGNLSTTPGHMTRRIAVGKDYFVVLLFQSGGSTGKRYFRLFCFNKHDINTVISQKQITSWSESGSPTVWNEGDIIIEGGAVYALEYIYKNSGNDVIISRMSVYSLPDLKLLKTVTGFYGPEQFLGKRDGKLYIADNPPQPGFPKRLGIYDTLSGKLKFINTADISSEIEFQW